MIETLPVAIGIGLVVNLVFSELFGLTAGGLVVPGYIALHLTRPWTLILTLAAGVATYLLVRAASSFAIIYGRRRVVLMILVGYLMGMSLRSITRVWEEGSLVEYQVIGFIIPGLIAIWLDRQGILQTLASLLAASVVVRLILILALGSEFMP